MDPGKGKGGAKIIEREAWKKVGITPTSSAVKLAPSQPGEVPS